MKFNNIVIPRNAADEADVTTPETNEQAVDTMDDLDALLDTDEEKKGIKPTIPTKTEDPKDESNNSDEGDNEPEDDGDEKKPADNGVVTVNNTDKANDAFAAMRVQLAAQNKLFKKLADSKGISVDQLKSELNKEAVEKTAARLNVTPEVYERLSKLEEDNKAKQAELDALKDARYREQQTRMLTQNIEAVQKEHGLSDDQVRGFVNETINQGMDILKGNVPLTIVYKGMKFDELVKAEVEKAKQEVIAQYGKADKYAASTVKGSGNTDKDANAITSMADLDALLGK